MLLPIRGLVKQVYPRLGTFAANFVAQITTVFPYGFSTPCTRMIMLPFNHLSLEYKPDMTQIVVVCVVQRRFIA